MGGATSLYPGARELDALVPPFTSIAQTSATHTPGSSTVLALQPAPRLNSATSFFPLSPQPVADSRRLKFPYLHHGCIPPFTADSRCAIGSQQRTLA